NYRTSLIKGIDLRPGSLKGGDLVLRRHGAVADVIDPPGKRVYRRQSPPFRGWQQGDAVGEVLRLLARNLLALPVGGASILAGGWTEQAHSSPPPYQGGSQLR